MNIVHLLKIVLIGMLMLFSFTKIANADAENTNETIYINGGIGLEESDEFRARAGEFNLRLYFSESKSGRFIAGTKVTVSDKNNHVLLDLADAGPMLFARLANGAYKVTAQFQEVTITRNVVISNRRGTNVYLNWKNTALDTSNAQEEVPISDAY